MDLLVQLPDNCTVPKYIDSDNVMPRSAHMGVNEDDAASVQPQIHFALVYFGVAPETVEAQEAHGGMFDLVLECGSNDSILIPKTRPCSSHSASRWSNIFLIFLERVPLELKALLRLSDAMLVESELAPRRRSSCATPAGRCAW